MSLYVVPISLRQAQEFILLHHRHSPAPRAMKFAVGVLFDGDGPADPAGSKMVGVGVTARPSARELDNGRTIEVTRTCTDGTRNANSMLYGACCRAARAMGYLKAITYTEEGESGSSLRAAGFEPVAELPPRGDWQEHTKARLAQHYRQVPLLEPEKTTGGKARIRWEKTWT